MTREYRKQSATCQVEGCDAPSRCRSLCVPHLHRFYRYGDPTAGAPPRPPKGTPLTYLKENLFTEVQGCKEWPYAKSGGYGTIRVDGKRVGVHVFVCEAWHGAKPEGDWEAAHTCRSRSCFNGQHLGWKTPTGNAEDRVKDGTNQFGTASPNSKLGDSVVLEIRKRYDAGGVGTRPLAVEYGMSRSQVRNIVLRRQWKHLP